MCGMGLLGIWGFKIVMVSNSHLSHPKYRPDIDGMRAVAVLSVVVFHAFPSWLKGGFVGVDVFFVISGFLISTIIFENLESGNFRFSEFYYRRIKRIFPVLAVVLIVSLGFGWMALLPEELNQLGKHAVAGVGFFSNFVFWSEAGYFDNSAETKPLLHLWSLGVEEQFYIVWPVLLWFAWKRRFNLLVIALLIFFVSLFLNLNGVKRDPVATFFLPHTRFWELLSGSVLAWFVIYKKNISWGGFLNFSPYLPSGAKHGFFFARKNTVINIISFVGFFLLLYGFWRITKSMVFPGKWAVLPVLGTVLMIAAGPEAWINRNILSNKVAVWFGLISYPLYLWHWPILSFARILENEMPARDVRIMAVLFAIFLAWLSVKMIERPLRHGNKSPRFSVVMLCALMAVIGVVGVLLWKGDFSDSHEYKKLPIKRKGFEHAFGSSLSWLRGKNDWLYLGNSYNDIVAKTKMASEPNDAQVNVVKEEFSKVAAAAAMSDIEFVLFLGPNKSTIYPENLPDELVPSVRRHGSFYWDRLKEVPNLIFYDPTDELLELKEKEGLLYWRTDTHWNTKGAFLSYSGFSRLLKLPIPEVEFREGPLRGGDLIEISGKKNFPIHPGDNWDVVWKQKPAWIEKAIPDQPITSFGQPMVVTNPASLSDKRVWVFGDSFANGLKPYFNATFAEVRYVGHWVDKLKELPFELQAADKKPDLIVVVRVERSF